MKKSSKLKRADLYYLPGSSASEAAKAFLEERDLSFRLLDVTKPRYAKAVSKETKQWSVPVLIMGKKAVVGFDSTLYEKILS